MYHVCLLIKLSTEVLFIFGRRMYKHLDKKKKNGVYLPEGTVLPIYCFVTSLRIIFTGVESEGTEDASPSRYISGDVPQKCRCSNVFFFLLLTPIIILHFSFHNLLQIKFSRRIREFRNSRRNLNSTVGGFGCLTQPPSNQNLMATPLHTYI